MHKILLKLIIMMPLVCHSAGDLELKMDCSNPDDDGACSVDRCMRFDGGILINTISQPARIFIDNKYYSLNLKSKNTVISKQNPLIIEGDVSDEIYEWSEGFIKVTSIVSNACTYKNKKTGKYESGQTCCSPQYKIILEVNKPGEKSIHRTSWGIQC